MSSPAHERLTEQVELPDLLLRRAALREVQQRQAAVLKERGVLTRAIVQAQYRGDDVPDEAMYWACVYRDSARPSMHGIRFIAYYADAEGELPPLVVNIPVYDETNGNRQPIEPFDETEVETVASAVFELMFEGSEFGAFPDLTPDLTDLIEPVAQ